MTEYILASCVVVLIVTLVFAVLRSERRSERWCDAALLGAADFARLRQLQIESAQKVAAMPVQPVRPIVHMDDRSGQRGPAGDFTALDPMTRPLSN